MAEENNTQNDVMTVLKTPILLLVGVIVVSIYFQSMFLFSLQVPHHCLFIFAQVSLRPTVLLNTRCPGTASLSVQK